MMYKKFLFFLMLVVGMGACSSSKNTTASSSSASGATPSSRSAGGESGSTSMFGSRSTKRASSEVYQKTHADLVEEAEERQEANAKRREKEAKLAEKPQYSDPSYFGHKKKPKKRPVGKRKHCKECGIVH